MHFPPPDVVRVEAFTVLGLSVRTDHALESDPEQARIANLWGRVVSGGLGALMDPAHPAPMFGVYHDYASDHLGPYSLTAGVEAAGGVTVPDGIESVSIPAGNYLRWTSETSVPPEQYGMVLPAMWNTILEFFHEEGRPHRAFGRDFERFELDGVVTIQVGLRAD